MDHPIESGDDNVGAYGHNISSISNDLKQPDTSVLDSGIHVKKMVACVVGEEVVNVGCSSGNMDPAVKQRGDGVYGKYIDACALLPYF